MSLIICGDCQKEYSNYAIACPICARPTISQTNLKGNLSKNESEKIKIVNRLNKERGSIQHKVSKRVVMKFTPKMHFKSDLSIERGVRTLSVIESLDDDRNKKDEGPNNSSNHE